MNRRERTGRLAEDLAVALVESRGGRILARNLVVAGGEVDLVAELGEDPVVIEVRSVRAGDGPLDPTPIEAFSAEKARRVRRLAAVLGCRRVDLIAVRFGSDGVDLHWVADAA